MNVPWKDLNITDIVCDSRQVTPGCLFVACSGRTHNGADFIDEAVRKGAKAVVRNKDVFSEAKKVGSVPVFFVKDTRQFLRQAVQQFYGCPSKEIRTLGVTGTNGKTTVTYLIEAILKAAGKKCGVIGTVNHRIGDRIYPSRNTTPGFLENQQWLRRMVQEKLDYCVMEVSSHALDQGRVDEIDFKQGVFTNLTEDHLDYHRNKEEYFLAKAKLFQGLSKEACAVINRDDAYALRLSEMTKARQITYAIDQPADLMAKEIRGDVSCVSFHLFYRGKRRKLTTRLIGRYNVYNALAAIAVCLHENIGLPKIIEGLEGFEGVPGRLEPINFGQPFSIFIDYAHTADALNHVLQSLRQLSSGRIILVFGCGGNRDQSKRKAMGGVAGSMADFSIVTSDNPRDEHPGAIVDMIVEGFRQDNYRVILDRIKAIQQALIMARPGDIVLIAGKGHEDYQIVGANTYPFNEKQIIQQCLR